MPGKMNLFDIAAIAFFIVYIVESATGENNAVWIALGTAFFAIGAGERRKSGKTK